jgi:hypothetical protein
MEPNFQTSFIPKKPMIEQRATSARPVGLLTVIAIIILFVLLVATGGLYFYKGILTKNITDMQNSLNLAQNRFEPSKITELQTLDKRLNAATIILSKHIAITPIFKAISDITMRTVSYTNFSYTVGDGSTTQNSMINIKMSGVAVGYRSIALQSDLLATNKNIIDPVFSNLTLDNKGNVVFDLQFSVDPSFVNYKQSLLTQS